MGKGNRTAPLAAHLLAWMLRGRPLVALLPVLVLALAACGEVGDVTAPSAAETRPGEADAPAPDVEPGQDAPDIQERLLRVQSTSPPGDPWQDALVEFERHAEELSGGKIQVDVFCCGELASDTVQEIEAISTGDLDGAFIAGQALTVYDQRPAVFLLPFIASDADAYHRMLDGPGVALWEEVLEPLGLHPIGEAASNQGFRQLTNNVREVRAPEDVNGLIIRVPDNPVWQDVMRELGAQVVSMPFGDLVGALQQGVVDGQENPLNLISAASLFEFQDHLTLWNYSANPIVFALNAELWQSMEPEAQDIVRQAAIEAAMWHRETYQEVDEQLASEMVDQFETFSVLEEDEIAAFRSAMEPVYERWRGTLGAELVEEFEVAAQGS